jgi:hypothetical protein
MKFQSPPHHFVQSCKRNVKYWIRQLDNWDAASIFSQNEEQLLTALHFSLAIHSCLPLSNKLITRILPVMEFAKNQPAWQKTYALTSRAFYLHKKIPMYTTHKMTLAEIQSNLDMGQLLLEDEKRLLEILKKTRKPGLKVRSLNLLIKCSLVHSNLEGAKKYLDLMSKFTSQMTVKDQFTYFQSRLLYYLSIEDPKLADKSHIENKILMKSKLPKWSNTEGLIMSSVFYLWRGTASKALKELNRSQIKMLEYPIIIEQHARLQMLRSRIHTELGDSQRSQFAENKAYDLLSASYQGNWMMEKLLVNK